MNENTFKIAKWISCWMLAVVLFSGCAWSVGGRADTATTPTKGQELMDLKRAKDTGALTEEEYQAQRKKIMDK
jgi:hypothetical protein